MANPFDQFDVQTSVKPIKAGNIDINNRPVVKNPDGSISTVRTISVGFDEGEYLIPTVSEDGRIMTDDEAIGQFQATGRHFGLFKTPDEATAFAESLHNQQDKMYSKNPFDQFDEATARTPAETIPLGEDGQDVPQKPQPQRDLSLGEQIVGAGEALLTTATGATGGTLGYLGGAARGLGQQLLGEGTAQDAQRMAEEGAAMLTYAPRTEAGQRITGQVGEALAALPPSLGMATPLQATGAIQGAGRTTQALGVRAPSIPAPRLQQGAQQAVAFADENNLPVTTSDISPPTSATGRGAQIIGEQTPFIGTGAMRGAQQEARVGLLQKLKDETPEISDEVISKSLTDSVNAYKSAIGKRYNSIAEQMADRKFPINNTIKAIDAELESLSQGGKIQDKSTISALQEIKDNLTSADGQSFRVMRDNRTFMRENLKSDKPSTQADRVIDRVYNAMTDDIQSAVKSALGDDAAFKLKQADKLFASEINTQKKTKLKNALLKGDVKPEEATKVLLSNSPSDVRELYASLDNKGRANARAAIINKLLEKANESPERFLSEANRYKSQYSTFFKGEEKAKLDGMIAYLNATRRAAKATVDTPTGQRNIPLLVAGGAGADIAGGGGAISLTIGTIAGLSRLYESKPVRNALIRLAKTKPDNPNYERAHLAADAAIKAQIPPEEDDKNE